MGYLVIPPGSELHKGTWGDSDKPRPALEGALLRQAEDKHWELVVSDSYVCAIVRLELVDDKTPEPVAGFVHKAALKAIAQEGAFRATESRIEAFRQGDENERRLFRRESVAKFPKVDPLWSKDGTPIVTLGLNARLLKNLADSLGSDELRLTIMGPLKAIEVVPNMASNGRGLIMPARIPNTSLDTALGEGRR